MTEEHVGFVRNESRSKVEVVFIKDGWTLSANEDMGDTTQDCYLIRRWGAKKDGTANMTEIRLRVSEMKRLKELSLEVVK